MVEKMRTIFKKHKKVLLIFFGFLTILFFIIIVLLLTRDEEDQTITYPPDYEMPPTDVSEPSLYYRNYKIEASDDVVRMLSNYEGEYKVYDVKDINHLEWVEDFVQSLGRNDLEYRPKPHPALDGDKLHTIDQSSHIWEKEDEFIHYRVASDFLTLTFDRSIRFPNVQVNPNDKSSVESGLREISKQFFSSDFEYQINTISREGENYKIDYSRLLDGLPITMDVGNLYLILTPAGHIKEGWFLLAEFEEMESMILDSAQEIVQGLDDEHFPKDLRFVFADPNVELELFNHATGYERTGLEEGFVNLDDLVFSYRYDNKFQKSVAPHIAFQGDGVVRIEDEGADVDDDFDVDFEINVRLNQLFF